MPDKIIYEWTFSVSRQTDIHSRRATDDAARSAVLSSALAQQKICACTVSIGGFNRLFYPQCSDIRTVIYLRTQAFRSSWTTKMRVSRNTIHTRSMGQSYASCQWLPRFPQRPDPMPQNEQKISIHILQEPVVYCNECIYVMCLGQMGKQAKFWHNWCEKPSTVPHTSWNFYLPFYQLSGWFWNKKFAILFIDLHLSPLHSAQNFIIDLCKTSVFR